MTDLSHILTEQLDCCETLAALQQRQRDRLSANDTDGVLSVLAERQAVINRFSELDAHIKPVRQEWTAVRKTLPHPEPIEELLRKVRDKLEIINESDRRDILILQQRRLDVGKQLSRSTDARKAHRAYGGGNSNGRLDTLK